MAIETAKRFDHTAERNYVFRDQLITKEDLQQFKTELLIELKQIIKSPASEAPKKWLKSEDVKKLLNVSPGTLQTLRINRTLQYTKIGGIIYYDYDHIQKIMQQNLRVAKPTLL